MLNCREVMLVNIFRLTPTKSEVTPFQKMVQKLNSLETNLTNIPGICSDDTLRNFTLNEKVGGWPPLVVAFQHYYDKEAILNRFQG